MLSLILSAILFLPQGTGDETEEVQLPPAVVEALAELDEALEARVEGQIVSVLFRYRELEHPAIIERMADALKQRKSGIRKTAVSILRFMEHELAFDALVEFCEKDKRLRLTPDLLERTLRAIGQHAQLRARKLFVEPPFESLDEHVIRARIRGLGRLRSKQSVADLIAMIRTKEGWKPADFADDIRLSLTVLTGVKVKGGLAEWARWWNENQEELKLSDQRPKLERSDLVEWLTYWELPIPDSDEPKKEHPRRGKE